MVSIEQTFPKDVLKVIVGFLSNKDSYAFSNTCKSVYKAFQETQWAIISRSARKWESEVRSVPFDQRWNVAKYFKNQSVVMKWSSKAQQRRIESQELQALMNTLRITKRSAYHSKNDETEEIDYQLNLDCEFQFGINNIAKIKYHGFDDEGCSSKWDLTWTSVGSDLRIFQTSITNKVSTLEDMKNMKRLHEYLGLSCSLLDLTKFLQQCLPVPEDNNFSRVEQWPNYDNLKSTSASKPKPAKKKHKGEKVEPVPGQDSFEKFYSAIGQPLDQHWVTWFCCTASSIYWTLGIQSEWQEPEKLDEASKQILDLVKTYQVEHRHRSGVPLSSQFTFEVNKNVYRFYFKEVLEEDGQEIVQFEDPKGLLYWILPNSQKEKIIDVKEGGLGLTDTFNRLHQEWNMKCSLNQFGIFLVLCLPYRLYDYETDSHGVHYDSTRFMQEWFEEDIEEFQMFKAMQKYLQESDEEDAQEDEEEE